MLGNGSNTSCAASHRHVGLQNPPCTNRPVPCGSLNEVHAREPDSTSSFIPIKNFSMNVVGFMRAACPLLAPVGHTWRALLRGPSQPAYSCCRTLTTPRRRLFSAAIDLDAEDDSQNNVDAMTQGSPSKPNVCEEEDKDRYALVIVVLG